MKKNICGSTRFLAVQGWEFETEGSEDKVILAPKEQRPTSSEPDRLCLGYDRMPPPITPPRSLQTDQLSSSQSQPSEQHHPWPAP